MSSLDPTERPPSGSEPREQDYEVSPKDARDLIRGERTILLESIRGLIERIKPLTDSQDGVCLFKTWNNGYTYQILVSTGSDLADENETAIIINKLRSAEPGESHYPDGQTMETLDGIIPHNSRWFNGGWEVLHRDQTKHSWQIPEFATLIQRESDAIKLYGQFASDNPFDPQPAGNLEGVVQFCDYYWHINEALALCNPVSLEDGVTEIIT